MEGLEESPEVILERYENVRLGIDQATAEQIRLDEEKKEQERLAKAVRLSSASFRLFHVNLGI